jgi:DNA invertase Pin-like site-specific DNA recombinase
METTTRYVTKFQSDRSGKIVRIAIYARLSRDTSGLSVNTSIQVAECLEEVVRYAQACGAWTEIVAIFEENDVGASEYSKKKRPDFQHLIQLIKENKIDVIFATEVERLVRRPCEAEYLR